MLELVVEAALGLTPGSGVQKVVLRGSPDELRAALIALRTVVADRESAGLAPAVPEPAVRHRELRWGPASVDRFRNAVTPSQYTLISLACSNDLGTTAQAVAEQLGCSVRGVGPVLRSLTSTLRRAGLSDLPHPLWTKSTQVGGVRTTTIGLNDEFRRHWSEADTNVKLFKRG